MIGIRGIAPFLQGTKTMVNSLPEVLQLTDDRLNYLQATGIENVLIDAQYSAYDFAKAASEKVLAENGLSGTDLDLIIMIKSRLPEAFFSSEATRLQKDIGAESAMTYSLSDLGCADMSMALKQASDFLIANEWAEHVLICYGCKPGAPSRYRHPVTVNGDGGLALLVGRLEEHQILDVEIKVDGAYWDLFKIDYQDKYFCDYKEELQDERRYGFELALESRNQFHALNQRILERNDLSKEDIDHFLLQNISNTAYQFYEMAYEIKIAPVCKDNLSQYGHLGPADILLNYYSGLTYGLFKKGDKVLLMNNSPVAAWSSILIEV